jgi:DNA-binding transcriptional ArsR family regulator
MMVEKIEITAVKMERIAEILKAIAHPVRLQILSIMQQHEPLSVAELMEHTGIEQSLLSHHLIKMKDKGVLSSIRSGRNINYRLVDRNILRLFHCMENCNFI